MAKVYFCGTDVYDCLPNLQSDTANNESYLSPYLIQNVSDIEFTHFYSVYQRQDSRTCYSWFVKGIGLPETQVFGSALCIIQVATCKNSLVGLSEDGKLYRISLEVDENDEVISLKTAAVRMDEDNLNMSFKKISSNDNGIYGVQTTPEVSKIYKIEDRIECIAIFHGKEIVDLSVGNGHFVALSDTGALFNWGNTGRSELAGNDEVNVNTVCDIPKRVEFFDELPSFVVKVICGGWHTLALTCDGDIYAWGWNESNQLGHSKPSAQTKGDPYPVDLGSAEDPIIDIAAGSSHSVALLKSGLVYSWGCNVEGQLGLGEKKEISCAPQKMVNSWEGTAIKLKCAKWSTFIFTE